jgi:predicted nucleic acid-binding protein
VRVALDTNVLAYAEGVNGASRKSAALAMLERLPPASVLLPVQVMGELFRVLVRKAGRTPAQARAAVLSWRDAFPLIATSSSVLVAAADLAADRGLSIWDSIILAAASGAECRLLLSEDMQDGFIWGGVTVANPFLPTLSPPLARLFAQHDRQK